jgi:translocation and assembly module TamA
MTFFLRASLTIAFIMASSGPVLAQSVSLVYNPAAPEDIRTTIEERLLDFRRAESALQAKRQARQASTIVTNLLNAYGYYAPTITSEVTETESRPKPTLKIDLGQRFTVDRAEVKFSTPKPSSKDISIIEEALPVKTGVPAIPAEIIDAERILSSTLKRQGYAFVKINERDVIGDKEAATLSVRYNVASGHKIRFGDMQMPDTIRTKRKYLQRLNSTQAGEVFDPEDLALFTSRLSETRLFSSSVVRLSDEPVSITEDGTHIHDVILELKERPRNTIAAGASFGTDEGFGVNAELTRRNLTRRGDTLIANATLAERLVGLDLVWRRPNELGYGKGVTYNAAISDENTDAFDQQLARIGAGLEIIKGPRVNYGFGIAGQYIRERTIERQDDFQTISGYAAMTLDYSDSLLDPRRGWRAEGRVAPSYAFSSESGDTPYLRAVGQGRAYLPLDSDARFVAAGRLRLGTLVGAKAQDVPAETRFYAGGGGSVRGYGFQAIGPFDAEDVPLGGRSLIDSSIEARWRYNNRIGVVAFVDAGNVSDEEYPRFENLRVGAGLGARYMTPAGPIRVDVGTPLNPSDRDEPIQLYISIGQAF